LIIRIRISWISITNLIFFQKRLKIKNSSTTICN
jgi:hypothetical protein